MPQIPAAILLPARGSLAEYGFARPTPQLVQITALEAVGFPQFWQNELPSRGFTPHFVQAIARSSTWLPQFRQNIKVSF